MSERFVRRLVVAAAMRAIPTAVGERITAELIPTAARLLRKGHQTAAEDFWRDGVDRILREVLDDARECARAYEVEGTA
jgi:hypothetical protein